MCINFVLRRLSQSDDVEDRKDYVEDIRDDACQNCADGRAHYKIKYQEVNGKYEKNETEQIAQRFSSRSEAEPARKEGDGNQYQFDYVADDCGADISEAVKLYEADYGNDNRIDGKCQKR